MDEKIRGKEVWWKSEKGNVAVVYDAFGLGMKYHAYRKVRDDAGWALGWRYEKSFESPIHALSYFEKSVDLPILAN